jgi:hypothetical protein
MLLERLELRSHSAKKEVGSGGIVLKNHIAGAARFMESQRRKDGNRVVLENCAARPARFVESERHEGSRE